MQYGSLVSGQRGSGWLVPLYRPGPINRQLACMNKIIYFAVGIFAFLAFIIAFAPASLLLRFVDDVTVPGLNGFTINGSIWQGDGELRFQNLPSTSVSWSLSPVTAATGTASVDLAFQATGLSGHATGDFQQQGSSIEILEASLDSSYVNQIAIPEGVDLTGEFSLTDAHFEFDRNWLQDAGGLLEWTGGIVNIQTPSGLYTSDLPPMIAHIEFVEDELFVPVTTTDGNTTLIEVRLDRNGWAKIGINHAFFELAGIALPASSDNTDPAILIEEQFR